MLSAKRSVVLVIRDGWGENHDKSLDVVNAVKQAKTPVCDELKATWPRTEIMACGKDVGLPEGVMGNSEVGHQNIGAGRIVDQEIVRIDKAFESPEIKENGVLKFLFENVRKNPGNALHLMGLCSDAGVHSVLRHLYAILTLAKEASVPEVFIHAFTDGRDSSPDSGLGFVREINSVCKEVGLGKIATVCGRYWAMDRDERWDRVEKAYNCITGEVCDRLARSAEDAIQEYYERPLSETQKGDEFVLPTWIAEYNGAPMGPVQEGDSVLFFNFRGDRPRELVRAFLEEDFEGFDRGDPLDICFATLTEYKAGLCPNVVFPRPPKMKDILGKYLSDNGIAQFRCAETEKYPHVTFFFNDYRDEPFPGEERKLIPSPRDVATYDQKPEMSAFEVGESTRDAILSQKYGLVVVNFANPDMVGHTGNLEATKRAVEMVDGCIGRIMDAAEKTGAAVIITADHGNADQMEKPETHTPHTQHTLNPVEVLVCGKGCENLKLCKTGRLGDLAPTILELMALPKPAAMTGESLIQRA